MLLVALERTMRCPQLVEVEQLIFSQCRHELRFHFFVIVFHPSSL